MEDRIAKLEAALEVAHQALLEVDHAQANGPGWYTRGESGLREHVRSWVRKGLEAIRAAQTPAQDGEA